MPQDPYFGRPEISNSDLSALKNLLYPREEIGNKERAYANGTLLDNMITEIEKVDFYRLRVQYCDYQFTQEEFDTAAAMKKAFLKDPFCKMLNDASDYQAITMNYNFDIEYNGFQFQLSAGVRCKWDLLARGFKMGGDIKSTTAQTLKQFYAACHLFDYFRSRAWYMDLEGIDKDVLIGISKVNKQVFKIFLDRKAPLNTEARQLYELGKAQYQELAFKYWMLFDGLKLTA
ncbi:hypothetical protein [Pedobacter zeae]|uniref:Uncharacterized protein n=1 Tax=Pedobacter zeae TaxID=1737356 RepID=A0A7W6K9I5_9SPHI|nr:hypothetical protein [Pedobacter zeae]MBB4107700.1 hypothetical protein [Pedobacter zeae]GGG97630.1 hypothetical protein GCM10007422_09520 [Pedobacter zeae]